MTSPPPEHRFTISDYILDSITVSAEPSPSPSPGPRPAGGAMTPPPPSGGLTSPSPTSHPVSSASPASPTSTGASGSFRMLPNIPRSPPPNNILGPGPTPIPASPEQPPSRSSSSSPSPTNMGLTYPPRSYTTEQRQYHGSGGEFSSGTARKASSSGGTGSVSQHGPASPESSRPGSRTRPTPPTSNSFGASASSLTSPTGGTSVGYVSRQISSTQRHPMEPRHPMEQRHPMERRTTDRHPMEQRHPMEPRNGLSPLPANDRLSVVSDRSRFEVDEKVDGVEKSAPVLNTSHYPPPPATTNKWVDGFWPNNLPCRLLIIVTLLEAVIDICIQANLLWRYDRELGDVDFIADKWANGRRLKYFLVVFIIAHIVQVTLTAWAVFYRNTIQIVGLAIFNALLLVYAAIQVGEIAEVFRSGTPYADSQVSHRIFSLPTKILSGLVIAVIAAAEIAIIILAWFIWREFGWRIYRFLGADLQIRRYYRQYQIFECILCFSFFFFVGFSVQFIFMVLRNNDPEKYVTIIMLPISLVWLAIGAIAGRWELPWLMGTFLAGLLGGVAYFTFKIVRIWTQPDFYDGVQKSLTIFSVLSLVMLVLCFTFAIVVWRNFGKGLKRATGWRMKRKGHRHTPSDEMGLGAPSVNEGQGQNFKLQHRLTIE